MGASNDNILLVLDMLLICNSWLSICVFFQLIFACKDGMTSIGRFHYFCQLLILLRDKWERWTKDPLNLVISDFQLFLRLVFLITDDCYTGSLQIRLCKCSFCGVVPDYNIRLPGIQLFWGRVWGWIDVLYIYSENSLCKKCVASGAHHLSLDYRHHLL